MQNCKGIAYENSLSFVGTNDIKTLIDRHKGNEISDILFIFASASISCIIPILTNLYSPQHLNSFATRELRSTILEQKYNSSTCHCFQINLPKFSILLSNSKLVTNYYSRHVNFHFYLRSPVISFTRAITFTVRRTSHDTRAA